MKVQDIEEIHNYRKLDAILLRLCQMVVDGKKKSPDLYGAVAACVLDTDNRAVYGINLPAGDGRRLHAERVAIMLYKNRYGDIPKGSILLTTCSPCSEHMAERHGDSCTDLINSEGIGKVYCGFIDPTQPEDGRQFNEMETAEPSIRELCQEFAATFMDYEEDQADRVPESARANVVPAQQILDYVKDIHPEGEFNIDHVITDHPHWTQATVPLTSLHLFDPEQDDIYDPYNRVQDTNLQHVDKITPIIGNILSRKPIVIDDQGYVLDGNHRALAARNAGMKQVPVWMPIKGQLGEAIQLGPRSQKAKAWIEKVYAKFPQTWQNNHVMPMGGTGDDQQFAMFELEPSFSQRDAVEIKWFQAYPMRQGVGSRAMKELQRMAREDGVALTLYPWDKGQVSQSKLTKFYRGAGFKPTAKGAKNMAWSPVEEASGFDQEAGIGIDGQSFKFKIRDLVALANRYPVQKVDPRQFADQIASRDEDHTQSMARAEKADLQYPIIVVKRNNGGLWIADGTHRAHKAILNKLPSINAKIIPVQDMAVFSAKDGVEENFHDGKKPGRKGLAKRMGVNTKASVSTLRNVAKHSTGEKARMAHWMANMKAGRAKK